MRSEEVRALTGTTHRQLDHWTRRGWITPSIAPGSGSGSVREWSLEDVVHVAVMTRLVYAGLTPTGAAVVCRGAFRDEAVKITVDVDAIRQEIADRMDLGRVA